MGDPPQLVELESIFTRIVSLIIPFGGIALFIMLLIGGIQYISSGGDPKKASAARNVITYAIGGLILLALAYFILIMISAFTGNELILNFRVRTSRQFNQ